MKILHTFALETNAKDVRNISKMFARVQRYEKIEKTKTKKRKKMRAMRLIAKWAVCVLLVSPVLLLFTEGADGAPTVWNYVGLVHLGAWTFWAYRRSKKMEEEERAFHDSMRIEK